MPAHLGGVRAQVVLMLPLHEGPVARPIDRRVLRAGLLHVTGVPPAVMPDLLHVMGVLPAVMPDLLHVMGVPPAVMPDLPLVMGVRALQPAAPPEDQVLREPATPDPGHRSDGVIPAVLATEQMTVPFDEVQEAVTPLGPKTDRGGKKVPRSRRRANGVASPVAAPAPPPDVALLAPLGPGAMPSKQPIPSDHPQQRDVLRLRRMTTEPVLLMLSAVRSVMPGLKSTSSSR